MKVHFYKLIVFMLFSLTVVACVVEKPTNAEDEKSKTANTNGSNNGSNNSSNNGSNNGSNNSSNNGSNNGSNNSSNNGSNNGSNNEKKTIVQFTVEVKDRFGGRAPVSNINVFIYKYKSDMNSSIGNYYSKTTTDYYGKASFSETLPFTSGTLYYKVAGMVTQNGVTTSREQTGSVTVLKGTTSSAIVIF